MDDLMHNEEGYLDLTGGVAVKRASAYKKRKFRPFVYICSRYTPSDKHTVIENERDAIKYSRFAIEKGYIPLTPHLLFTRILQDNNPDERNLGLFFGSVFLDLAKEIWIFSDEPYSKGMFSEYRRAKKKGYKIRYFTENMMEVSYAKLR